MAVKVVLVTEKKFLPVKVSVLFTRRKAYSSFSTSLKNSLKLIRFYSMSN